MKLWAAVTVLLYLVMLTALAVPVLMLGFGPWPLHPKDPLSASEASQVYANPGFWLWLILLGIAQSVLLLVPIGKETERPRSRRKLLMPVLVTSFFLANLVLCAVTSLIVVFAADAGFDAFALLGKPFARTSGTSEFVWGVGLVLTILWTAWGIVFYRFCKSADAETLRHRTVAWLLRGSILELLVAVPCHVIVRRRDDCCAPAATFWGIVTGISVMLLAFGPGVFFLFVRRCQRQS